MGKRHGIPVIVDLGSGVLVNLEKYGLAHETTVQEVLKEGADVVCFSGDKLLGGPQAGIIAGKKKYIKAIENHPMMRMLRLDKFTTAALEATFREYLDEKNAWANIPVLQMIARGERGTAFTGRDDYKGTGGRGISWQNHLRKKPFRSRRRFPSGRGNAGLRCGNRAERGKSRGAFVPS